MERMNCCENVVRLARKLGVDRRLLYKWRDQPDPADGQAQGEAAQYCRESALRREVGKLKRLLADKTVEVDCFKRALQTGVNP